MRIDATGLHYRQLNDTIKAAIAQGETEFDLVNVVGHRYIGCGIAAPVTIRIEGIPGNDLAAFMDGPQIYCSGNGQDGIGNTMNDGLVVISGHAGDVMGYSMRGGRIFIRGNAGYRIGINMKSYQGREPEVVIGGRVRDFCGEVATAPPECTAGACTSAAKFPRTVSGRALRWKRRMTRTRRPFAASWPHTVTSLA